ncbi:Holliday junction resolvase RuvX [Desulfoplanes formicivorans]|nr:Holliday junction resolvase RuvX [Desulfoplanes formicivorans]
MTSSTIPSPRYLGIDFGLKRVGLAVAGPNSTMVFPLKTIFRTTRAALFEELLGIIAEENIQAIVLGLPLDLEGNEQLITRQVRNFAASLARRVALPIHLENEALTSFEARNRLHEARVFGARRKNVLDQMAAVAILESFLSRHHHHGSLHRPQ